MMRKYKTVLFAFVVCVCVAAAVARMNVKPETDHFTVSLEHAEQEENIRPWLNDAYEMFVFLPSYVNLQNIKFSTDLKKDVYLDGRELATIDSFAGFKLGQQYPLQYTIGGRCVETTLTFLCSADIAAMHIDTQSGDLDYIHASKENSETARMRLYQADGTINYVGESVSVEGRGNATWHQHDKKPYNIRLDREENLLGLGDAKKWVLLANASDQSNLRNKLVFDLSSEFGLAYAPDARWVDLYLNSEYRGVYLLCEPNEIHAQRIDIASDERFLVSLETEANLIQQNHPYIKTVSGQSLRIRESTITSDELIEIWQSIENAVMDTNGVDAGTGKHYSELLDVDLLARKYLLEEIFGNLDGFRASCYFYTDTSDKICAGPVWDYDKAMGNDSDPRYNLTNPDVFVITREENWVGMGGEWIKHLYQDQSFRQRCIDIFEKEIYPSLNAKVSEKITAYTSQLENSYEMNRIRWYDSKPDSSLEDEGAEIYGYISRHMNFLKSVWIDEETMYTVSFLNGTNDRYISVQPGTYIDQVPEEYDTEDQRFLGWYYKDADQPFDMTQPINNDVVVCARWEDESTLSLSQIALIVPLGAIFMMGLCLLGAEWRQNRGRQCQ